jgi:hypothetical protein
MKEFYTFDRDGLIDMYDLLLSQTNKQRNKQTEHNHSLTLRQGDREQFCQDPNFDDLLNALAFSYFAFNTAQMSTETTNVVTIDCSRF